MFRRCRSLFIRLKSGAGVLPCSVCFENVPCVLHAGICAFLGIIYPDSQLNAAFKLSTAKAKPLRVPFPPQMWEVVGASRRCQAARVYCLSEWTFPQLSQSFCCFGKRPAIARECFCKAATCLRTALCNRDSSDLELSQIMIWNIC